jgi:hypothetical protein
MKYNNKKPQCDIPDLDEEFEEGGSKKRKAEDIPVFLRDDYQQTKKEVLYNEYGIKPNLPLRTKIEQLTLAWRLSIREIAHLLELDVSTVEKELNILREDWRKLGSPLDDADREVQKGQTIAELSRLKLQVKEATTGNPDPRMLTLAMNIEERLMKLKGLDGKPETEVEEDTLNPVENALNQLTPDQQEKLLNKLRRKNA